MGGYDITLSRGESGDWVGRCDAVRGNTQASTVRGALAGLRDVIGLVDDLQPTDVVFSRIEVDAGDPTTTDLVHDAVTARRSLAEAETQAREQTTRAVHGLTEVGLTRRDVGALLGISHQRVDQLLGARS